MTNFKHIHFKSCSSTQTELLNIVSNSSKVENILISTNLQTKGKGRQNNIWLMEENKSIAMSIILLPNPNISLTSLEIGVLICQFFSGVYQIPLKLKWPNDILTDAGKKCGGILAQMKNNKLIVGIGLNLSCSNELFQRGECFKCKIDGIFKQDLPFNDLIQQLPKELYKYILNHRINDEKKLKNAWNDLCYHQNFEVVIEDSNHKTEGIFKGIGNNGQALITANEGAKEIYSGSLFLK